MKLGNIGSFVTGGTPSRKHPEYYSGNIPWVSSTSLGATYITDENVNAWITTEAISNSSTKLVQKDSILIGIRVGVGKCSITTFPLCTSQDVVAIEGIDTSQYYLPFVLNFINSKQPYFDKVKRGATIKGITTSLLKDLDFPNIPISDQIKISNSLDKISSLIRDYKNSVEMLDVLVKSRFVELFSDVYEEQALGAICSKITDGEHGTVERYASGRLYLMARNITMDNNIDLSEVSYISENDHQRIYKRCNPEQGDLLLVCVGATIGKVSIVPEMEEFSMARSVALIKPKRELLDSHYLLAALQSEKVKKQINNSIHSSAQGGLYTSSIKTIQIPLPPIDIQKRFSEEINKIDKSKFVIQKSLDEAQLLFDSLMQEYFG